MSSENLTLRTLKDELYQEMSESLKNSKLSEILEKYGISEEDRALQFNCVIDLKKTPFADAISSEQMQDASLNITEDEQMHIDCIFCVCWGCCH